MNINIKKVIEVAKKINHSGDYGQLFINDKEGIIFFTVGDGDAPEVQEDGDNSTTYDEIIQFFSSINGVKYVTIEFECYPIPFDDGITSQDDWEFIGIFGNGKRKLKEKEKEKPFLIPHAIQLRNYSKDYLNPERILKAIYSAMLKEAEIGKFHTTYCLDNCNSQKDFEFVFWYLKNMGYGISVFSKIDSPKNTYINLAW